MRYFFPVVPPTWSSFWLIGVVLGTTVCLAALTGYIIWSARHTRVVIENDGIRITGSWYGRLIPAAAIHAESAAVLDIEQTAAFQPVARTNGIGLPGYRAGWFRLRSGERALLFVSSGRRVVYVPTREGFSLLVSVQEPDQFLARLREMHSAGGGRH